MPGIPADAVREENWKFRCARSCWARRSRRRLTRTRWANPEVLGLFAPSGRSPAYSRGQANAPAINGDEGKRVTTPQRGGVATPERGTRLRTGKPCWPRPPQAVTTKELAEPARRRTCFCYLQAYYRHVPVEDLARGRARARSPRPRLEQAPARRAPAAGPGPWSGVRPGRPRPARFDPSRRVIDIIHRRHAVPRRLGDHGNWPGTALDSRPHPASPSCWSAGTWPGRCTTCCGAAHRPGRPSRRPSPKSWTHIEISGVLGRTAHPRNGSGTSGHRGSAARTTAPPSSSTTCHRVLHDVRVAVEDYPRMQAKATWLADRLAAEGTGAARPRPSPCCAGWPTITSLSWAYREYDLGGTGPGTGIGAARAGPGTGLGILRHDKQGLHVVRRAAPRGPGPGPGTGSASS